MIMSLKTNDSVSELPQFLHAERHRFPWQLLLLIWLQSIAMLCVVIAGIALFGFLQDQSALPVWQWWWGWGLLGGVAVLIGYGYLSYAMRSYAIREHDLSLYSGVLFRRVVIQPYTRIQHIEVTRGPWERMLGLATLKLFSAGGAVHSLSLAGLNHERAENLRDYIVRSRGLLDEQ